MSSSGMHGSYNVARVRAMADNRETIDGGFGRM